MILYTREKPVLKLKMQGDLLFIINNHSFHATDSCDSDNPTAVTAPVLDSSDDIKQNKKSPSEYSSDSDISDDTSNRGHKILKCIKSQISVLSSYCFVL